MKKVRIIPALWTLAMFGFGFAWVQTQLLAFGILALIFIVPMIVYVIITIPTTHDEYLKYQRGEDYQSLLGTRTFDKE